MKRHSPPDIQELTSSLDYDPLNLRIVDRNQQNKNKKMYRNNTSGIIGVSLRKKYNTWRARIRSDGVTKHLGSFPDFISACEARIIAEVSLGFHKNHGGN